MSTLNSPTADLNLSFTPNNTSGQMMVDLVLTLTNDYKLVSGPARLVQDVTRWLLTPLGGYVFDPTFGNPMLGQLLMPSAGDPNVYLAMVQAAEAAFLARQQIDAAAGYLSTDEQVVAFTDTTVTIGDGVSLPIGTVTVSFTIVTRSGTPLNVFAPFSALVQV